MSPLFTVSPKPKLCSPFRFYLSLFLLLSCPLPSPVLLFTWVDLSFPAPLIMSFTPPSHPFWLFGFLHCPSSVIAPVTQFLSLFYLRCSQFPFPFPLKSSSCISSFRVSVLFLPFIILYYSLDPPPSLRHYLALSYICHLIFPASNKPIPGLNLFVVFVSGSFFIYIWSCEPLDEDLVCSSEKVSSFLSHTPSSVLGWCVALLPLGSSDGLVPVPHTVIRSELVCCSPAPGVIRRSGSCPTHTVIRPGLVCCSPASGQTSLFY